jgi:hypothetical protein
MNGYRDDHGTNSGFYGTCWVDRLPPKCLPQRLNRINKILTESGFDPIVVSNTIISDTVWLEIPENVSDRLPVLHSVLGVLRAESADATLRLKLITKVMPRVTNFSKVHKCWNGMETFIWRVQPELWVQDCADLLDSARDPSSIIDRMDIYFCTVLLNSLGLVDYDQQAQEFERLRGAKIITHRKYKVSNNNDIQSLMIDAMVEAVIPSYRVIGRTEKHQYTGYACKVLIPTRWGAMPTMFLPRDSIKNAIYPYQGG